MNKLPKDIILKLIEELSPQDFISFCTSNTSDNVIRSCNSNKLWEKRLKRDFPYLLNIVGKDYKIKDPKALYIGVFTRLSKISENFTETVLEVYGENMTKDFKKFLYDNFYKFCDDILENTIFINDYRNIKWSWASERIKEMYNEKEFTDFRNFYFPRVGNPYYGTDEEYWESEIRDNITVFVRDIIGYLKRNLVYE